MFHNKKSAKALLTEANSEVEQISAQEAIELIDDENTVFVDVRETSEAQQGMVPGAGCRTRATRHARVLR